MVGIPALQVMRPGETRTRVNRTPNFPMTGVMKPFGLYPLMIHPVLPGETLEHFQTKVRVLSKPVKHPLAGAWLEHWLCYVKFTDLDRALGDMFISDSYSTAGHTIAANNERFFAKSGQIDWVGKCLRRIHAAYFAHANETVRLLDGVPQVKISAKSWYQNAIYQEAATVPNAASVETLEGQLSAFEMMRQMSMTELTYEKYLEEYGVQSVRGGIGEPEILRYARSWTMPTNTIEGSTGAPSSAWVWSDDMKVDKPKRFEEPGFLIQLACVRPKMYMGNIASSMVGTMWGFADWFPAYNLEEPSAGAKSIVAADAVVTGHGVTGIIYDHRDLLAHGEQFVNSTTPPFAIPKATAPNFAVGQQPEDLRGEYATSTNIDDLFVSATATDKFCYYEGMSSARIRGHIRDFTGAP